MTTLVPLSPVAIAPPFSGGGTSSRNSSTPQELLRSKILIIDDEPITLKLTQRYLGVEGYTSVETLTDSRQAIQTIKSHRPDVVLLDIMMAHTTGFDVIRAMRSDPECRDIPVVILTGLTDHDSKREALAAGANDFLGKPIDVTELIPRVRNVLTLKYYADHRQQHARELEAEVRRRTAELVRSREEVIHCLARAAEFRDDDTGRHIVRVGRYARVLAEEFGWTGQELDCFEQAAQLHDIGKIGVPDSILLKPGKLTPEEFDMMRHHTGYGRHITQTLEDSELDVLCGHTEMGSRMLNACGIPVLSLAATISLTHHEKWDGSGYPAGLAGEGIPLEGRIVAVADVFDALSSRRPYKSAFPLPECFAILRNGRGQHFDPQVIDAFFRRQADIVRIHDEHRDAD